jgi:hypothetical protein
MKVIKYLKENNLVITEKGKSALIKAMQDIFPEQLVDESLTPTQQNNLALFIAANYDMPEEEFQLLIKRLARYIKIYAFS